MNNRKIILIYEIRDRLIKEGYVACTLLGAKDFTVGVKLSNGSIISFDVVDDENVTVDNFVNAVKAKLRGINVHPDPRFVSGSNANN